MIKSTGYWVNEDEQNIYYAFWKIDKPKAVVCMVHGLGEHIERYDQVAKLMNESGFAFIGNDHRGHGRSEGRKGDTKSYSSFLNEVDQLCEIANETFHNIPIFLYGHSMGGNIVLNYGLKTKKNILGIVATSPWLKLTKELSRITIGAARIVNKFGGIIQSNKINPKYISRNSSVVAAYKHDKYIHDQVSTVVVLGCIDAANEVLKNQDTYPYPTFVVHGTKDALTSHLGSRSFFEKNKDMVTYKELEGLYHECHNEPEQELVLSSISNWMLTLLDN